MKLDFEIIKEVGNGNYPDLLHFANTQSQIFSIKNGAMVGLPTERIDNGDWENATFQDEVNISPDANITNFQVNKLQGFGAIGCYKSNNTHKLIIYEFAFEMDRYLNSGSIKHSIDNPISSFALTLENPLNENPEYPGNVAVNEENSLLSPGAKITFKFSMGNSEEYELGTFYVDRSNFTLLSETANVDGRNLIGKALKDQTLDEKSSLSLNLVNLIIEELLQHGKLDRSQYLVENTSTKNSFEFQPNTDIMKALEEIFKAMIDWKIEEKSDGTVVIGSPGYSGFTSNGIYTFYRNKDIFSRDISRDDMESYRRVCVHDSNFTIKVYKDVASYTGWNLQANKTMYVPVADGTRLTEATAYADEIALRLENVGKVESFTGPFRPYLICGDEAVITDDKGSKSLGLITEITHNFGKNGFSTNFTVDSGGKLGKGRLTDYISKVTREKASGSIGYE